MALRDQQALKITQDLAAASQEIVSVYYNRILPLLDKQESLSFTPVELNQLLVGTPYEGVPVVDLATAFQALTAVAALLTTNNEENLRDILRVIP